MFKHEHGTQRVGSEGQKSIIMINLLRRLFRIQDAGNSIGDMQVIVLLWKQVTASGSCILDGSFVCQVGISVRSTTAVKRKMHTKDIQLQYVQSALVDVTQTIED